ncbi:methionyl-tRNA formyltransferase [Marine Group III euryarchaeote]|nr:methionyl-tRNA formyltransferase [Marine Group III euryarchaeote]
MRILFAGNKIRGLSCLKALVAEHEIVGVIGHPKNASPNYFVDEATGMGFKVLQPANVNSKEFIDSIRTLKPDLIILAGFGYIVNETFLSIPKYFSINLHGGKLPKYRGSSPMNWALINGEKTFTLSIIQVDSGVDTGGVLVEKTFDIGDKDTIVELHKIANDNFPILLEKAVNDIKNKVAVIHSQDDSKSSYYPLRFPSDGFVLFDQLTAEEINNKVRALTTPYPGVFTFYNGKKVKILKCKMTDTPFFGEPGRIYRISDSKGILVCASDRSLWLEEVQDFYSGEFCQNIFHRYESLLTTKEVALKFYDEKQV